MNGDKGVLGDPKLLVVIIIYSGVAQFGLAAFPPLKLDHINYVDILRYHVLVLLVGRITLTYGYAAVARTYTVPMFILELVIAFVFAGQLRLLEKMPGEISVVRYYSSNLFVIGTIFFWSHLGGREISSLRGSQRYPWLRRFYVVFTLLGIAVETWQWLQGYLVEV